MEENKEKLISILSTLDHMSVAIENIRKNILELNFTCIVPPEFLPQTNDVKMRKFEVGKPSLIENKE